MAKITEVDNKNRSKRVTKTRKDIPKKIKKIKKENPNLTETDIKRITEEEKQRIYEKYRIGKQIDYLDDEDLLILDALLTNRDKKSLAKDLGIAISTVYYRIGTPLIQKAFQAEMKERYLDMKKHRKAMYVKIAEKALNLLMNKLEEAEAFTEKYGFTPEKTKDIIAIIEKVVSLMQEEDGGKTSNVNLSGGLENTNVNVNGDMKDFDLADKDFRMLIAKSLSATSDNTGIIK